MPTVLLVQYKPQNFLGQSIHIYHSFYYVWYHHDFHYEILLTQLKQNVFV